MRNRISTKVITLILLASFGLTSLSCNPASSSEQFFGATVPPKQNILRYVTGDEPESLDPPVGNGQPEARIYMALFDGLVEYHPKTMNPVPAMAERWDINNDSSEFTFHLRKNGRWSNGDPIDANDFVYSFRRALSPQLASRNAYLAAYIKYSHAYTSGEVFVRDSTTKEFLLARDFEASVTPEPLSVKPLGATPEYQATAEEPKPDADSAFHQFMHSPTRLTLPGDVKARNKLLDKGAKLKSAIEGKELVPVTKEDLGVEAVDKYTVRISLSQSAPFFLDFLHTRFFV